MVIGYASYMRTFFALSPVSPAVTWPPPGREPAQKAKKGNRLPFGNHPKPEWEWEGSPVNEDVFAQNAPVWVYSARA
jgi:hypothetical protein